VGTLKPRLAARVVGMGSIGTRYARVMAKMDMDVRAMPLSSRQRSLTLPSNVQIEVEGDEALPHVEFTVIASQTKRHIRDAVTFGHRSSRTLVEKPIATNFAELGSIDAGLQSSIFVSAPLKAMEGFATARDLIDGLGLVRSVRIQSHSWLPDWRPDQNFRTSYSVDPTQGGVLRDLIHEIDYAVTLFGIPSSIKANLTTNPDLGLSVETRAEMEWRYSDFSLEMSLDFGSRSQQRFLLVVGSDGVLLWDVLATLVEVRDVDGKRRFVRWHPQDMVRDDVVRRQLSLVFQPARDFRTTDVNQGAMHVLLCDLARTSSDAGGVPITVPSDGGLT